MLKEMVQYFRPYRTLFALDMLAAFVLAVCDLIYPMVTREIINHIVPNKALQLLFVYAMVLLGVFLVKMACNYFVNYWGHVVGVRMQADMREKVFLHLQKLPSKYFDENKTGVIMSRIVNDLMDISELAHHGPEDVFISLMMFLGSFAILSTIHLPLTIFIFLFLPLVIYSILFMRKKMNRAFMDSRIKSGEVNAVVENSIAGVRVTKSFCTDELEGRKFRRGNGEFVTAREASYRVMGQYYAAMNFWTDFLELVALAAAGYCAYRDWINLGDFAAYILYIKMFIQPMKRLISFTEQYQNGITGFKRFMEIMAEEEEKEPARPAPFENIKGEIDIDHVTFSYENEKTVLRDLSLHIPAGRTVAIVGPSGGGKSTLCNLLPRFYDYNAGDIRIDGISIKSVRLKDLRENIGIVQQDVFLFTGTLRENILCGKPDASEAEMIEASRRARIHDFIMTLPDGYDTDIGERGVKLSGGQKQRVSIARVFLKNPPILILDEATSALDNVTEHEIQASLEELGQNRTSLVIAHRLTTIRNADEILVMTEEGIVERGTHQELLAQKGIYEALHGQLHSQ